jgi:hypothetical protein
MGFFGDDDIPTMFTDSPHSITVGGVTEPCWYDVRDEVVLGQGGVGGQLMRLEIATVRTTDFPGVSNDSLCTMHGDPVDDVDFTIYEARKAGDGATTELILRRI